MLGRALALKICENVGVYKVSQHDTFVRIICRACYVKTAILYLITQHDCTQTVRFCLRPLRQGDQEEWRGKSAERPPESLRKPICWLVGSGFSSPILNVSLHNKRVTLSCSSKSNVAEINASNAWVCYGCLCSLFMTISYASEN